MHVAKESSLAEKKRLRSPTASMQHVTSQQVIGCVLPVLFYFRSVGDTVVE